MPGHDGRIPERSKETAVDFRQMENGSLTGTGDKLNF
jgi:hypothetical protein